MKSMNAHSHKAFQWVGVEWVILLIDYGTQNATEIANSDFRGNQKGARLSGSWPPSWLAWCLLYCKPLKHQVKFNLHHLIALISPTFQEPLFLTCGGFSLAIS